MNARPLFLILLAALPAFAGDVARTIVTKDNQTFRQAVISGTDANFATITYIDGVAHVPIAKLPDDLLLKLGRLSKADLARMEAEARKVKEQQAAERAAAEEAAKQAKLAKEMPLQKETPAQTAKNSQATPTAQTAQAMAPDAVQEKKLRDAFEAITSATQAEANAFYKMPEAKLLKKFGMPLNTIPGQDAKGEKYRILVYDDREGTNTHFIIYESKGCVETGFFKGKAINNPKPQKRTDGAKKH